MYRILPYERRGLDLFRAFDNLDKFFETPSFHTSMKADIMDLGDKYIVEAELPGFNKEDIKLDINGDFLTLSAEHTVENEENDENVKYIRKERTYQSYKRQFDISGIDLDGIDANYVNGVLSLTLPKKQEQIPVTKSIEIK